MVALADINKAAPSDGRENDSSKWFIPVMGEFPISKQKLFGIFTQLQHHTAQLQNQTAQLQDQTAQLQNQTAQLQDQQREINELRAELNGASLCEVGTTSQSSTTQWNWSQNKKINFKRTFPRTPTVVTAVAQFYRNQKDDNEKWGVRTYVGSRTTTSFIVYMQGWSTYIESLTVSWIACA